MKASIRAKVEHPFQVIKRQFEFTKVRYRGLMKNTAQIVTLFALSNLWMARRQFMGARGSVRLQNLNRARQAFVISVRCSKSMLALFDLIAAMACGHPIHSAAIANRVLKTIPRFLAA